MSDPMQAGTAAALTEAVEGLAREVKGLRGDVKQLRADLGFRTKRLWLAAAAIAAAGGLALALVIANLIGAVSDLRDQEAELSRARDASCVVFAGLGHPELLRPESGELARQIVADSAEAAQIMGCAGG
jgi:hypothetical protein